MNGLFPQPALRGMEAIGIPAQEMYTLMDAARFTDVVIRGALSGGDLVVYARAPSVLIR